MTRALPRSPSRAAREAAAWVVRHDAGLSDREAQRFARWLSAPANRQAWEAARALWSDLDQAGELARQGALQLPPQLRTIRPARHAWRRPAVWAAAAVCALVLLICLPDWLLSLRADVRTRTQIEAMLLADGSRVTLDAQSALAFEMTPNARTVRLLAGAAVFEVAPDPGRPFVVEAQGGSTTALGTVFMVRREARSVQVTGIEHRIAVRYPESSRASVTVQAGQSLTYGADVPHSAVELAKPGADAWSRHLLMFQNQPLGEVISILGRYYPGRLLMLDPVLAKFPVSGVFDTADPAADVTAIERALGIRSLRPTRWLIVIYR